MIFPLGSRVFADVMKLIWGHAGLEWCLGQEPVSQQEEGNLSTDTHRGKAIKRERTQEWCGHKPENKKDSLQPTERGKEFSLKPSEEAQPCLHLDFGLRPPGIVREYNSCSKPPGLQYFAMVALGKGLLQEAGTAQWEKQLEEHAAAP